MNHYTHLTLEEREQASNLHFTGKSISQIVKILQRSKATISRTFRRNTGKNGYLPIEAQRRYEKRRKACKQQRNLLQDKEMYRDVKYKFLTLHWSPEEIAGRARLEGKSMVSYSTIYRSIYKKDFDEPGLSTGNSGARMYLRHHNKKRHRKGQVENRGRFPVSHPLSARPAIANERMHIGDWEVDTMKGRYTGSRLVTLVDRKSRYLLCMKVSSGKPSEVTQAMIKLFEGHPVHTVTPDRGIEFSQHHLVSAACENAQFYFPPPHHPQERGTNENTNGLIREYFRKGCNLDEIPDEAIAQMVEDMNNRPRKRLNFKTPTEVYRAEPLHLD